MGAAEDDRAPTEERTSVNGWGFCSTGGRGRLRSYRSAYVCLWMILLFDGVSGTDQSQAATAKDKVLQLESATQFGYF